ncbi:hypothetical protein, partial [Mesorhizobium sp. M1163]|uniref:hypothetical protein n=1 Tax=Mesorhizobium sp. M1163 TaxID=2957065 RepID=UPI003334D41A
AALIASMLPFSSALGFTYLDVCVVHHAANRQAKPKHAVHIMAGGSVLYGHYRREVGTRSVKFGFQLAAGLARVYADETSVGLMSAGRVAQPDKTLMATNAHNLIHASPKMPAASRR